MFCVRVRVVQPDGVGYLARGHDGGTVVVGEHAPYGALRFAVEADAWEAGRWAGQSIGTTPRDWWVEPHPDDGAYPTWPAFDGRLTPAERAIAKDAMEENRR